ncbi:MAG TPA: VCBS repeat-containing protein, partial [Longimicrobium sp.]|nr:VCBS repeat-containing protein [Longimicrobium sp.]
MSFRSPVRPRLARLVPATTALCLAAACADAAPLPSAAVAGPATSAGSGDLFVEVVIPQTVGSSMDSQAFDADGDGDLDLLIAKEVQPNVLLLNDGTGRLTVAPAGTLPGGSYDSEDVAVADFDRDGDLDAAIAAEDDRMSELYLNDGHGVFT